MKKTTTKYLLQLRMSKTLPWYGAGHHETRKAAMESLKYARGMGWPKSRTRVLRMSVTTSIEVLR